MKEYKRLTRKNEKGKWIAEVGHYEIYIDHEAHANVMHGELIDRLAELENKIESGELVELPKKLFLGKNEIGENEYAVRTTTSRLFYDEKHADDFLKKEKARLQKGAKR